jgi:hypothetical protein
LLKEKETMERKFPNHTFSCAQNFRRWSTCIRAWLSKFLFAWARTKDIVLKGQLNKLLEDMNRRLITRAKLAHESHWWMSFAAG